MILEFGFWTRAERDQLRDAARALGTQVELVSLDVPLDVRWQRLQQRDHLCGVAVTRQQLVDWERWWEPATAEELAQYDPEEP